MAMCQLYLKGAEAFVSELERWKPRSVAYRVGTMVLQRLIDLGQYTLIDEVASHSLENACILFAVIHTQSSILRYPELKITGVALNALGKYHRQIKKHRHGLSYEEPTLSLVNSVIQASIASESKQYSEMADILDIYIPPVEKYFFASHSDEPRFTLLRANCLRAALRGESILLSDLAKPEIKKQLENESHSQDRDTQEFIENVGTVLPWHQLWTKALLGQLTAEEIDPQIEECLNASKKATRSYHRDGRLTSKEISRLWGEILLMHPSSERMMRFVQWKDSLEQKLFTPALTGLVRLCAKSDTYTDQACVFAKEAFEIIEKERMDAEQKIDSYVDISRAIYALTLVEPA